MSKYDPKVTLVAKEPLVITPEDRARAMWLLRKYSSLTYIRRMASMFARFVTGYEDFINNTPQRDDFHRDYLGFFRDHRRALEDGIARLERGSTAGYSSILEGCGFYERLTDRRSEFGLAYEEIGFRFGKPSLGLYAWADSAGDMAVRIDHTLSAQWAFPQILAPFFVQSPFPPQLDLEPAPFGELVRTGGVIPTAGIWRPVDFAWGCPGYFRAERIAPAAVRADRRFEYPATPGQYSKGMDPRRTTYEYATEPVRWQLLWEDHRYDHGKKPLPEEEAFLDPSTDPPPWPPVHAPPN